MDFELELIAKRLKEAKLPEDIFGPLTGTVEEMLKAGRKEFLRLSKRTHPDTYPAKEDKDLATSTFTLLTNLWQKAELRIKAGIYGLKSKTLAEPVKIHTRKREYVVTDPLAKGDVCNLYHCTFQEDGGEKKGVFKVVRQPRDNDLVTNEAKVLRHLQSGSHARYRPYVPELVENFGFREGRSSITRQANVLDFDDGFYSLKEVIQQYPKGLDPRDMAWMWRRLLVALGFAHQNGVIHGAVLPTHVLIHPTKHGLVLIDWTAAVIEPEKSGERIRTISTEFKAWYPAEVLNKETPTTALDIYMGARCMVYLLGGNPISGILPDTVSRSLRAFFNGCVLPRPSQRPSDAWGLLEEFDELLEKLWGKRRYRPFAMPSRT